MQDDFNSAPTPAAGQTPPAPQHLPPNPPAPGQPRAAGQPLGVINPNIPSPAHGQAGAQPLGQGAGWAGQTVSYHGQVSLDPPTVADPQPPAPWPGIPGAASPFAPTVHKPQPSSPKPPIYQPPGYQPAAPPIIPAPPLAPPVAPLAGPPAVVPMAPRVPAQAVAPRRSRLAAWVPLPHALLLLGVALLFIATRLPWGVDGSGNIIMLQTASVPALSADGGNGTALQVALNLIGAVGVLSVALLLSNVFLSGLNKLLGRGCVAGCVITPLYPILLALIVALVAAQALAAGFGGLGALAQAPGAQSYGMAGLGVAHHELGYYLWYTGLILNVTGMLGEFVVWRR